MGKIEKSGLLHEFGSPFTLSHIFNFGQILEYIRIIMGNLQN